MDKLNTGLFKNYGFKIIWMYIQKKIHKFLIKCFWIHWNEKYHYTKKNYIFIF